MGACKYFEMRCVKIKHVRKISAVSDPKLLKWHSPCTHLFNLLLFLPATETCSLNQFLFSACLSVYVHRLRWAWIWRAVGTEVWGAWLVWDPNLILQHTDFIKRFTRFVMFIWMANRLFHGLGTWKHVSKEQYTAASLLGLSFLCFWKCSGRLPRDLGELEFSSEYLGSQQWKIFQELEPNMTWPGKYSSDKYGALFYFL